MKQEWFGLFQISRSLEVDLQVTSAEMPNFADVPSESLFQFDLRWVHFQEHSNQLLFVVNLNTREVLDAFKGEIVFQRLQLNIVAQPLKEGFQGFEQIAKFWVSFL